MNRHLGLARQQGRPRRDGAREPNGRHSRRLTQHQRDMRVAAEYWRQFAMFSQDTPTRLPAGSALLNLLNRDKLAMRDFFIALHWAATDPELAPRWPDRTFLTQATGFDFSTREGCAAVRRFARAELGMEPIKHIDAAVFRGDFSIELPTLSNHLRRLWDVLCRQGMTGSKAPG